MAWGLRALLVGLALFSFQASRADQPPPLTGAELSAQGGTGPVPRSVPMPMVPEELRATGAQGKAVFDAVVGVDGRVRDVTLRTGTGSSDLDAHAAAVIGEWILEPARDAAAKPVAVRIVVPVEVRKDTIVPGKPESIGNKRCADFVADVDWMRARDPSAKASDVYAWKLAGGLLMLTRGSRSPALTPAGAEEVLLWCRANPGARFFEQLTR